MTARRAGWILAGIVAVVVAAALIWPVTDWLAAHDVGRITGPHRAGQLLTAREAVRSQMLTLAAGLFAAGALVFTALNFILSREAHVTDRYAKAIEQLGAGSLDARIGGIYALERIARDSARDHPTVVEVLAAFVREHSHEARPSETSPEGLIRERVRADVQAALTVLGRRNSEHDRLQLDLASADLSYADLSNANLSRASLGNVIFHGAILYRANLTRAFVMSADLTAVVLRNAKLTDARLNFATLDSGLLAAGDITGADLRYALYPMSAELPKGWKRRSDGKLIPAGQDHAESGSVQSGGSASE